MWCVCGVYVVCVWCVICVYICDMCVWYAISVWCVCVCVCYKRVGKEIFQIKLAFSLHWIA